MLAVLVVHSEVQVCLEEAAVVRLTDQDDLGRGHLMGLDSLEVLDLTVCDSAAVFPQTVHLDLAALQHLVPEEALEVDDDLTAEDHRLVISGDSLVAMVDGLADRPDSGLVSVVQVALRSAVVRLCLVVPQQV